MENPYMSPETAERTVRMRAATSRFRELTLREARIIAVVAASILGTSLMFLLGMGFQPGWANGWPMGISKHAVFASFVTIIFVIGSLSGTVALLVVPCALADRISKRPFVGWLLLLALLLLAVVAVLALCPRVYAIVHAEIVRGWP